MTTEMTLREDMAQRWLAADQDWLRDHGGPFVMLEKRLRAFGFELDPAEVGPSRRTGEDLNDGVYLTTIDPETNEDAKGVAYFPEDVAFEDFVVEVVHRHAEVQRVQIWQSGDCIWAMATQADVPF